MKQHRFLKEGSEWYIDLPEYLEQGGSKGDPFPSKPGLRELDKN